MWQSRPATLSLSLAQACGTPFCAEGFALFIPCASLWHALLCGRLCSLCPLRKLVARPFVLFARARCAETAAVEAAWLVCLTVECFQFHAPAPFTRGWLILPLSLECCMGRGWLILPLRLSVAWDEAGSFFLFHVSVAWDEGADEHSHFCQYGAGFNVSISGMLQRSPDGSLHLDFSAPVPCPADPSSAVAANSACTPRPAAAHSVCQRYT